MNSISFTQIKEHEHQSRTVHPIRWRDNTCGDEAGRTTPPRRYAGGRRALVIVSRAGLLRLRLH